MVGGAIFSESLQGRSTVSTELLSTSGTDKQINAKEPTNVLSKLEKRSKIGREPKSSSK